MNAEPAAASGASGANQSNQNGADAASRENAARQGNGQAPHTEPIGDRAGVLETLKILEVPSAILERVRQDEEKENAELGLRNAEGEPAQAAQPTPPAIPGEDDEELTEEQRRNTDPKLIARINKLTAKIKGEFEPKLTEKDAEIARLKAQIGQPQGQPQPGQPATPGTATPAPGAAANVPYAHLKSEAEIAEATRVAREIRNWATMNLEGAMEVPIGVDDSGEVKTKDFTAAEVRAMLVNANNALEVDLPGRVRQLRAETKATQDRQEAEQVRPRYEEIAEEEYPELKDPESPLSQHIAKLFVAYPFLKTAPDGKMVAADIVSKALARQERLAKAGLIEPLQAPSAPAQNGNGRAAAAATVDPALAPFLAPKPPRAPAVPSAAQGAPPSPSTEAERDKALEDYLKTSRSEEDHNAYVARLSEISAREGGVRHPARV